MGLIMFSKIPDQFCLEAPPSRIQRWGEGHIHETYLIETRDHHHEFILQKINHNIFKDIPGMMANIEAVTRHLNKNSKPDNGHYSEKQQLRLVYTHDGHTFYKDENGDYWRMFYFISGTVTFQTLDDPSLAAEAGRAIGLFQSQLTDLPDGLVETLPDFHDINFRIVQYYEAKKKNALHRLGGIVAEADFAEVRFDRMKDYLLSLREYAAVRVTHNDTKLNNILFDHNRKAVCLIDLDTVMPGYVHFDYGDALRTMSNTAPEDENDLSKVRFNKEVYDYFTLGYLEAAGNMLNDDEKRLLPFSPVYLTFIIGLRFLTDYLNGDIYFRIHHPGHNLERAKVQFKLVSEIENSLLILNTDDTDQTDLTRIKV